MRSLVYIVLLMAAVCCGCSHSKPEALERAERLMLTDPSAAYDLLNSVDVTALQDSSEIAHWALLYTEAMVANRMSAPTDTIVDIAIDYYRFHGFTDQFRRASELKALIRANTDADALSTALYLQKEKEYFLYKEQVRRRTLVFCLILLSVFAASIFAWMRQRIRIQRLRNEALIAEASALRVDRADMTKMQTKLQELLGERFALIDSLCQTYYEKQGIKLERQAIVDQVKAEIDAARKESLPQMERAVNDCHDGVLTRVRECFPEIKPEDYRLLVYLACGLSTRSISLLLGESVEVVYKRKSRLKSRLKARMGADFAQIVSVF